MPPAESCPCGSGTPYAHCCGRYHGGAVSAPTAEALMRSRYCAFVRQDAAYLLRTWHPDTRPANIDFHGPQPVWRSLEIRRTEAGTAADDTGRVEFVAHYLSEGRPGTLHETSRFVRRDGQWLYVGGDIAETPAPRPGRNAPCPCGSGRKFKRCCGS